MNKFLSKIKNILYSLPFGLKAADTEIMGSNISGDGNDTVIKQQVNDNRVAKHLLKGELTQEVKELRYRTYKVCRETDKYEYVGHGMAVKKEEEGKKGDIIKFSQENKLVCEGVLSELNNVGKYGVEKYTINIDYSSPVRFKLQEFLTLVDVTIKDNESIITTLHFSDVKNPQEFKSKPFILELEKLEDLFNRNDTYGLSRNDFATSILCMNFTTFKATDKQPDVISYSFLTPELIGVHHENGEFKLIYKWQECNTIDLAAKFYDAELEKKYKNKEKKNVAEKLEEFKADSEKYIFKCSKCGREINLFEEGYINDKDMGKVCIECFKKHLLETYK